MVFYVSNILTFSRIAAIPVIGVLIYASGNFYDLIASCVFFCACLTDYFDGLFARMWRQTTALGRFMDPVADKLMVATVLMLLVAQDRIAGVHIIPAVVILCREILVSGLREFLAELKILMPVSALAKIKTFIQMSSLGLLILDQSLLPWSLIPQLGLLGLWIAALLTLITGYDYLKAGLKYIDQEDAGNN